MERTVLETIGRHSMLAAGDNVIVGLSGGADSVALFHFFLGHKDALGVTLAAAHFNHGLRGEHSDGDEAFVRGLCARHGVPLHVGRADMLCRPRPSHTTTEEWARNLRYEFFAALTERHTARIATAHTQSDNAETVLFNAARGSGPRGLAGIPPCRGPYIRPLLDVNREKIEQYCAQNELEYVTDHTNFQQDYSRNRIRHSVLPQLELAHPGAARALTRLAADMRELDGYLTAQAEALIQSDPGPRVPFLAARADCGALCGAPGPVRLKALALLAGKSADRAQLALLEDMVANRRGALQISAATYMRVHRGELEVYQTPPLAAGGFSLPFQPGTFALPGGYQMRIRLLDREHSAQSAEKSSKKLLTFDADYDKMLRCDLIRTRRQGDVFRPKGRGITKKLRKWMNERGIVPFLRDTLPLLASRNEVLWVWGEGFAEGVDVTPATRRILRIEAWLEEV